jgi:phage N-6-adenine-methyltransferase
MDEVHSSSKRADWETPPDLIADLKTVFTFDLDVCASRPNVCENYFDWDEGLSKPWEGLCWMNPPYGKGRLIDRWVDKAMAEGQQENTTVLCLLPARTATNWWHDNVPWARACVFVHGRLTFRLPGGACPPNCAGFPSALVVFGDISNKQIGKLAEYGMATFPRVNAMDLKDWTK